MKPVGSTSPTHYSMYLEVIEHVAVPDFEMGTGLADISTLAQPIGSSVHLGPHEVHVYSTPPDEEGLCTLMRLLVFEGRTPVAAVKNHALGDLFFIPQKSGVAPRMAKATIHYVGSHLGGEYISNLVLTSGKSAAKEKSQDELDAGFKFIRECGPVTNSKNEFNEFAHKQKHKRGGVLQGWDTALIVSSLSALAKGKANCSSQHYWPITLKDLKSHFLKDVVLPILKTHAEVGTVWLGKSGIGKTPAVRAICICLSDYLLKRDGREEEPAFRTSNSLDFFKGESGTIYTPCVYDDGEPSKNDAAALKTFLDSCELEANTMARWTSSRSEQGQSRHVLCNKFLDEEEDDVIKDLTHKSFVKMIAPFFPTSATTEDRVAIMKRSWSVCFGNKNIFVRPPTEPTSAKISKYSYWPQGQRLDLLSDE
eukprot:2292848-Amphidinium_carterae.1